MLKEKKTKYLGTDEIPEHGKYNFSISPGTRDLEDAKVGVVVGCQKHVQTLPTSRSISYEISCNASTPSLRHSISYTQNKVFLSQPFFISLHSFLAYVRKSLA